MRILLSAVAFAAVVAGAASAARADDILVPGDFRTIDEALRAAEIGDRIVLTRRTYREGRLTVHTPFVEIVAPEGAVLRTRGGGSRSGAPTAMHIGSQGVTLRGITFANGTVYVISDGVTLEDCLFRHRGRTRDRSILVRVRGDRATVRDTRFLMSGSPADRATAISVEGNGTIVTGVEISGSWPWPRGVVVRGDYTVVATSLIQVTGEEAPGVDVVGHATFITENEVYGGAVTADGDGTTVQGNDLIGAPFGVPAIGVTGDGGLVVDNTTEFGEDTGIVVRGDGNEVRGNTVRHHGSFRDALVLGHGIVVRGSGNRLLANVIEGPIVDGLRVLGNEGWIWGPTGWTRGQLGAGNEIEETVSTGAGGCGLGNWTVATSVTGSVFLGSEIDVLNGGHFDAFVGNEFETGGPDFWGTGGGADLPDFGEPRDPCSDLPPDNFGD